MVELLMWIVRFDIIDRKNAHTIIAHPCHKFDSRRSRFRLCFCLHRVNRKKNFLILIRCIVLRDDKIESVNAL